MWGKKEKQSSLFLVLCDGRWWEVRSTLEDGFILCFKNLFRDFRRDICCIQTSVRSALAQESLQICPWNSIYRRWAWKLQSEVSGWFILERTPVMSLLWRGCHMHQPRGCKKRFGLANDNALLPWDSHGPWINPWPVRGTEQARDLFEVEIIPFSPVVRSLEFSGTILSCRIPSKANFAILYHVSF